MVDNISSQLWKISLGMVSIYGPYKDFDVLNTYKNFWRKMRSGRLTVTEDILYGVPRTENRSAARNKIMSFLTDVFHINGTPDLMSRMDGFAKGSAMKKAFDEKRRLYVSLPQKERLSLMDPQKQGERKAYQYMIIDRYDSILPPAGILAYDIANYTNLCRLGTYIGCIKAEDMMASLQGAALMAQKNYKSFEEFGYAATIGLLFQAGKVGDKEYRDYFYGLNKILTHKDSYWNNLDWNMELQ